jgi:hypothetical protein
MEERKSAVEIPLAPPLDIYRWLRDKQRRTIFTSALS